MIYSTENSLDQELVDAMVKFRWTPASVPEAILDIAYSFGVVLTCLALLLLHLAVIYYGAKGLWDIGCGRTKLGIIEFTAPIGLYAILGLSLSLGYANLGIWLGAIIALGYYVTLKRIDRSRAKKSTVVANSEKQV